MAETKYGKLIKKEPIIDAEFAPAIALIGGDTFEGLNCSVIWKYFTAPHMMEEEPHAHDFDQLICFFGSNPLNIKEFDAEIEMSLGEEGEKHIITSTTIVHLPKGLIHCPLYFKKVVKPFIFMNIALTPRYGRSVGSPPPPMIKRY